MFIHLHTHSCYSFLEALPTPAALAQAAARHNMPALALTDHHWLSGAVPFVHACQQAGIAPILGLEVDLLLPYHGPPPPGAALTGTLVLLAQDRAGWANLCRLSTRALTRPGDLPCIALEDLGAYTGRLLCLTGGTRGAPTRLLSGPGGRAREAQAVVSVLAELFPDRLYVELQAHPGDDPQPLAALAARLNLPLVATHGVYYLEPAQAGLQRTLAAIRTNTRLSGLAPEAMAPPNAWFLPPEAMQPAFKAYPQALAATHEIAERCQQSLPLGETHYPSFPLPPGQTARQVLTQKALAGARRLYGPLTPTIERRLESELEVIAGRGYDCLFLIAEEVLAFARQAGIPTASRGSASSSLVAHCLGITTPDPLALDLYFERFLNPSRATPPDIDTDICSRRRDELLHHVFETYGVDRTTMVGTISSFRPRSALSDTAKAYGLTPPDIRLLANRLPYFYGRGEGGAAPFAELAAQHNDPRHLAIFRDAAGLLGLPRHLSVHPGGVVITPGPVTDYLPLAFSDSKNLAVAQFGLDSIEALGMIKLDMLGVRGLTVLGDVAASIQSWRRKEFRTSLDVLEAVPEDDPEVAALIAAGRTVGCFSIESPGMRAMLREIHADCPADIMVALALFRPGPLKGGLRDAFVRRHNQLEATVHLHPMLAPLLQETYGVILYQEQVLKIAHELAGLSLAEADLLRRAMSHFDPGKQMQTLQEHFISGAGRLHSVTPEVAARIWEMMAAFAGYGFPKAHAASYAVVAWRSAWCKAHYPAEFIAAVLANHGGYYPQSVYLNEARRLGLELRPPHVNHAHQQFSVAYPHGEPVLVMGLDQIRDLTHRTQERILHYRPFHDLAEFLQKVDPRREEAENLVQVGAFDSLGAIPDLLRQLVQSPRRPGQLALFAAEAPSGLDWSLDQKVAAQQRLLGTSLEAHPLQLHARQLAEAGVISTVEALTRRDEAVRVGGMRQILRRSQTARGEWMAFLSLEDLEGILDVIIFPDVYARSRSALSSSAFPLVVEGKVELDPTSGEPILTAQKIWRVSGGG